MLTGILHYASLLQRLSMCGICVRGIPTAARHEVVERMLDTLAHRGPDGSGVDDSPGAYCRARPAVDSRRRDDSGAAKERAIVPGVDQGEGWGRDPSSATSASASNRRARGHEPTSKNAATSDALAMSRQDLTTTVRVVAVAAITA